MIYKTIASKEYFTEERCHIIEILNDVSNPSLSIARARIEQGITSVIHSLHDTDEYYYIIQGEGLMMIDGVELGHVQIGDVVKIEKGKTQSIRNTCNQDLIFLCLCHPRFVQENYNAIL